MTTLLVIEHFDEVDHGHLGFAAAVEVLAFLALDGGEKAFHHRVVIAIAAATQAAGDTVLLEHRVVVLARVGAALIG